MQTMLAAWLLVFLSCCLVGSVYQTEEQLPFNYPELSRAGVQHILPLLSNSNAGFPQKVSQQHDKTAAAFEVVNEWKYLDFEYPSYVQRQRAIADKLFIPENNLPLGIEAYEDRLFITTPRWKDGVPASLNYIPYKSPERSPPLRPYPNWAVHGDPYAPDCSKLMSVYRTAIDKCGRLWAIDSGIVNATVQLNQVCPPKLLAYDLSTDELLLRYELPPEQVRQDSLHSNLLVDVRGDACHDAHVFVTDVWRYGLVVYSLAKQRSWRTTNYQFTPTPAAADFSVYGLNFQWLDGVFGMSLSLEQSPAVAPDRVLYFHPMASTQEFMVSTALLRNESLWPGGAQDVAKYFVAIGDRGARGQSSTSGIARNGVQFFTQVQRDAIGCWDTAKRYVRANLALFGGGGGGGQAADDQLIVFPNDLKVDAASQQSVWVMSNRLPIYLYSQLDYSDINFRILRAHVDRLIAGTVCDPRRSSAAERSGLATVQLREGQCY